MAPSRYRKRVPYYRGAKVTIFFDSASIRRKKILFFSFFAPIPRFAPPAQSARTVRRESHGLSLQPTALPCRTDSAGTNIAVAPPNCPAEAGLPDYHIRSASAPRSSPLRRERRKGGHMSYAPRAGSSTQHFPPQQRSASASWRASAATKPLFIIIRCICKYSESYIRPAGTPRKAICVMSRHHCVSNRYKSKKISKQDLYRENTHYKS